MSGTVPQHTNSKYAWRELAHKGLPKRSAPERVADFLEIYGLYDEATAREQASRCIQCPNPSCVTGCPLCNPIPQWMLLTRCTSTLRARSKHRPIGARMTVSSSSLTISVCSLLPPASGHDSEPASESCV